MGEGRIVGDGIHCKVVPKKGPLSNFFKHLDKNMWGNEFMIVIKIYFIHFFETI